MSKEASGTVKYSGELEGSFTGEFEMTIDFEDGEVKGTVEKGPYSIDLEGTIEDGKIEAEGSVMGRNANISGRVNSDGSTVQGEWEVSGFGSGTWEGTRI